MAHGGSWAPVRGVALDFDGVLADTQNLHLAAWQATLASLGVGISVSEEAILGLSVEQFAASLGLPPVLATAAVQLKRSQILAVAQRDPPRLYPTVLPTLRFLAAEFRLGLVSSAERDLVSLVLEHYAIRPLFRAVITSSDPLPPKPDPAPYLACAERLDMPASAIVAIEDSLPGISSAKAAGMRVIAVSNTTSPSQLAQAHAVVQTLEQASQLLVERALASATLKAT
jgi:HAD superfamily hydrolase (TIGR01509 family)